MRVNSERTAGMSASSMAALMLAGVRAVGRLSRGAPLLTHLIEQRTFQLQLIKCNTMILVIRTSAA